MAPASQSKSILYTSTLTTMLTSFLVMWVMGYFFKGANISLIFVLSMGLLFGVQTFYSTMQAQKLNFDATAVLFWLAIAAVYAAVGIWLGALPSVAAVCAGWFAGKVAEMGIKLYQRYKAQKKS